MYIIFRNQTGKILTTGFATHEHSTTFLALTQVVQRNAIRQHKEFLVLPNGVCLNYLLVTTCIFSKNTKATLNQKL